MINPVIKLQKDIEKLKDFAIHNKSSFKNEEITKQTLILPFIKILGYDHKDPNEIKAEYSPENAPNSLKVDYCMCLNHKNCIYIEAKSFGKNLKRYTDQMKKYYDASKDVEYSILTNGTEYHFFTSNKDSEMMYPEPFFTFDLFDYSIDDLETLTSFIKNKYNYREMRIIAKENRIINKMEESLFNLLGNPDALKEFLSDDYVGLPDDTVSRLIPISMEKAIIKMGDEYEVERQQKVVLRYSEEQLLGLGKYNYVDSLGHDIFIPERERFDRLINVDEKDYSVEKGNPFSDFFIATVYTNGKNIQGYLIGHFLGRIDESGEEDITLYCAPWNDIESFVKNNPVIVENGFVNAKFLKRQNSKSGKVSYYLQSNISGVSFQNFPNLVVEMNDFEEFYQEFFSN